MLSIILASISRKRPLQDVTCTTNKKETYTHNKLLKGPTVEDASKASSHVNNTSSQQLPITTTQHIPPLSEYSEKDSDGFAHNCLYVLLISPLSRSEETKVCPCPTYTIPRNSVMTPQTRDLRMPPAATATWVPNQKVTPSRWYVRRWLWDSFPRRNWSYL